MEYSVWKTEVVNINQCYQRQDSVTDQMKDLYDIANKLGFYDAADYIKQHFMTQPRKRYDFICGYKLLDCGLQRYEASIHHNVCKEDKVSCPYLCPI